MQKVVNKGFLTSYHLKLIAIICMLIDHIAYVFFSSKLYLRAIGRIAFPLFAYMIVEGCKYTHKREKYLFRLGSFALISEIFFDMAFHQRYIDNQLFLNINFFQATNVFYTLFLAASSIHLFEKFKYAKNNVASFYGLATILIMIVSLYLSSNFLIRQEYIALVLIIIFVLDLFLFNKIEVSEKINHNPFNLMPFLFATYIAEFVSSDYGAKGILFILLIYLANNKGMKLINMSIGCFILYGVDIFSGYYNGHLLFINYSIMFFIFALISVVLIYFYNGQKGKDIKYFAYSFYPLHLFILAILKYFI